MLCWLICSTTAWAEKKPLWELGWGAAALYLPDYRGADESHPYLLPIPYVIYRGKRLQAERTTLKGRIFAFNEQNLHSDGSFVTRNR